MNVKDQDHAIKFVLINVAPIHVHVEQVIRKLTTIQHQDNASVSL